MELICDQYSIGYQILWGFCFSPVVKVLPYCVYDFSFLNLLLLLLLLLLWGLIVEVCKQISVELSTRWFSQKPL